MDRKIITKNNLDTMKLGSEFAQELKAGDVVLLFGNLGAGKTTFVQGLAKGLGIKDRILSPTFVLMRQYEIPHPNPLLKGEGDEGKSSRQARTIKNLNHVDLYRIENPTEIENLGLAEVIEEESSVTIIEWADRLSDFRPKAGYRISFEYLDENKREIKIIEL